MSSINPNSSRSSSFASEEKQFKEILELFSSNHLNKGQYLAVKGGNFCKINFLQLIWEKIKGVFLGSDATNAHLLKLTALDWMAKGVKYIKSKEDYQLIEALARQTGLISSSPKNAPKNIQKLTQQIGKKLFADKEKREGTTDNSPHKEEMIPEEATASLLGKFISQYEKQLIRFPEEVKKARQTFQNIYCKQKNTADSDTESGNNSFSQSQKDNTPTTKDTDIPHQKEQIIPSSPFIIDDEIPSNTSFIDQSESKTVPSSSLFAQAKSLPGKVIKKLTDHDLVKKHWKTAATITVLATVVGLTWNYSSLFQNSPLPPNITPNLPGEQPNKGSEDQHFVYQFTENLMSSAKDYLTELIPPAIPYKNPSPYIPPSPEEPPAIYEDQVPSHTFIDLTHSDDDAGSTGIIPSLTSYLPSSLLLATGAVITIATACFGHIRKKKNRFKEMTPLEKFTTDLTAIRDDLSQEIARGIKKKLNKNKIIDSFYKTKNLITNQDNIEFKEFLENKGNLSEKKYTLSTEANSLDLRGKAEALETYLGRILTILKGFEPKEISSHTIHANSGETSNLSTKNKPEKSANVKLTETEGLNPFIEAEVQKKYLPTIYEELKDLSEKLQQWEKEISLLPPKDNHSTSTLSDIHNSMRELTRLTPTSIILSKKCKVNAVILNLNEFLPLVNLKEMTECLKNEISSITPSIELALLEKPEILKAELKKINITLTDLEKKPNQFLLLLECLRINKTTETFLEFFENSNLNDLIEYVATLLDGNLTEKSIATIKSIPVPKQLEIIKNLNGLIKAVEVELEKKNNTQKPPQKNLFTIYEELEDLSEKLLEWEDGIMCTPTEDKSSSASALLGFFEEIEQVLRSLPKSIESRDILNISTECAEQAALLKSNVNLYTNEQFLSIAATLKNSLHAIFDKIEKAKKLTFELATIYEELEEFNDLIRDPKNQWKFDKKFSPEDWQNNQKETHAALVELYGIIEDTIDPSKNLPIDDENIQELLKYIALLPKKITKLNILNIDQQSKMATTLINKIEAIKVGPKKKTWIEHIANRYEQISEITGELTTCDFLNSDSEAQPEFSFKELNQEFHIANTIYNEIVKEIADLKQQKALAVFEINQYLQAPTTALTELEREYAKKHINEIQSLTNPNEVQKATKELIRLMEYCQQSRIEGIKKDWKQVREEASAVIKTRHAIDYSGTFSPTLSDKKIMDEMMSTGQKITQIEENFIEKKTEINATLQAIQRDMITIANKTVNRCASHQAMKNFADDEITNPFTQIEEMSAPLLISQLNELQKQLVMERKKIEAAETLDNLDQPQEIEEDQATKENQLQNIKDALESIKAQAMRLQPQNKVIDDIVKCDSIVKRIGKSEKNRKIPSETSEVNRLCKQIWVLKRNLLKGMMVKSFFDIDLTLSNYRTLGHVKAKESIVSTSTGRLKISSKTSSSLNIGGNEASDRKVAEQVLKMNKNIFNYLDKLNFLENEKELNNTSEEELKEIASILKILEEATASSLLGAENLEKTYANNEDMANLWDTIAVEIGIIKNHIQSFQSILLNNGIEATSEAISETAPPPTDLKYKNALSEIKGAFERISNKNIQEAIEALELVELRGTLAVWIWEEKNYITLNSKTTELLQLLTKEGNERENLLSFIRKLRELCESGKFQTGISTGDLFYSKPIDALFTLCYCLIHEVKIDDILQDIVNTTLNPQDFDSWNEEVHLTASSFIAIKETGRSEEPLSLSFDPHLQGHIPFVLADIDITPLNRPDTKPLRLLSMASPTKEDFSGNVAVIPEFNGYLHTLRKQGRSHLYISLQNEQSKIYEKERNKVLKDLQDDFPGAFYFVALAQDSDFYKQEDPKYTDMDFPSFAREFWHEMFQENTGFYFPSEWKTNEDFQSSVKGLFELVHESMYERRDILTKEEKQSFIENYYAFLEIFLLRYSGVDAANISCNNAISRAEKNNSLLLWLLITLDKNEDKEVIQQFHKGLTHMPALLANKDGMSENRRKRLLGAFNQANEEGVPGKIKECRQRLIGDFEGPLLLNQ